MTFAGSETSKNSKTMSRFVKQIMTSDNFRVTKHLLLEPNDSQILVPVERLGEQEVANKEPKLSPSAINTFRECQMKYFLHYRMGIHELLEEDVLLSHSELGTYLHDAMQEYYTNNRVIEHLPDATLHPIERTTVETYIKRIIKVDEQLAKKGLDVLETEQWHFLDLEVEDYGHVTIGGKLDRVDRVGGQIRIVDYKTGSLKKDNEFQINIYRLAYQQEKGTEPAAVLYLCKNKPEDLQHEVQLPDEQAFINELKQTVHDMLKLDSPKMAEKDATCRYCPFQILCNRHPIDL